MGILCPCGVSVDACSKKHCVVFTSRCITVKGNLTYLATVCVTTPKKSTLSLKFVDTECPNTHSFLFTANAITSVVCAQEGRDCVVTITGTGFVNGIQYPFTAVFCDRVGQAVSDCVQSFMIPGFFDQNGAVAVPQGSITALGCQEL